MTLKEIATEFGYEEEALRDYMEDYGLDIETVYDMAANGDF